MVGEAGHETGWGWPCLFSECSIPVRSPFEPHLRKGYSGQLIGSSDYGLDPSTAASTGFTPHLALYLFHDGLVKSIPGGNDTPSPAESYRISLDSAVYEIKMRKGL